ncbi:MAG: penicillin-binding protein 2 [Acidobacteriota bacterium]
MKNLGNDRSTRQVVLGRLLVLLVGVLVWSGAILFRLVDLQVFRAAEFRTRAETQQQGFIEISPHRGEILDRNGRELAISVRGDRVYAQPPLIASPRDTAARLAPLLQVPPDELVPLLTTERKFVYLASGLSPEQSAAVRELELDGIGTHEDRRRVYPHGGLAGHVLGYVSADHRGLAGLEYAYDPQIRGRRLRIDLRLDARRRSYLRETEDARARGAHLVLTLDAEIQHVAEEVLAATVTEFQARGGAAIVMEPRTGAILAMASYPGFHPEHFAAAPAEARRNRGIQMVYEPGSTFKLVTLAGVLNEGLAVPDEIVDCRVGTVRLGNKVFREAHHSFEDLTVAEILQESSNVGTVKLALRLGERSLYRYIERFGFGRKTGIDLPGEEKGLLRPPENWSGLSVGSIAIGQEIGVTALQMLRAFAAVANGGYLVRPFLVSRVVSPEGHTLQAAQIEKEPVLPAELTATLRNLLAGVVTTGTGTRARLTGYTCAGKTGTAQKAINGTYQSGKYVSSFVGFAPLADPKLAAIVVIDEPRGNHYGGVVAAPAFRRIMEAALLHCGVPQDLPPQLPRPSNRHLVRQEPEVRSGGAAEVEASTVAVPAAASVRAVEPMLTGEPSPPANPESGAPLVPDLTGLPLREVVRWGGRWSIALKVEGTGRVVAQTPAPGALLLPGMEVRVVLAAPGRQSSKQLPKVNDETANLAGITTR